MIKQAGFSYKLNRFFLAFRRYKFLYLLTVPAFAFTFVFAFLPMGGLIVAFKDFDIWLGFWDSPWTGRYGFEHFITIFTFRPLLESIWNTLLLSTLNLAISFPAPIIFALLLNELRMGIYKKTVQTISYMPHFLSWISVIGLCMVFFSEFGPLNELFLLFNPERQRVLFLAQQENFVPVLLFLNVWKTMGFQAIIFLAAITGVDPQLYEAASIDGASRFRQIWHITLPGITPTIAVMFILSIGSILASNFELVFGLQNAFIDFETIDTIIFKYGLQGRRYSLATAVGLARGLIALFLTLGVNSIARRVNDTAMF